MRSGTKTVDPRLADDLGRIRVSDNVAAMPVDQFDARVLVEHKNHHARNVQIALRGVAFPDDFLFGCRDALLQRAIPDRDLNRVLNIGRRQTGFRDIVLRAFAHRGDGNFLVALARQHHHRHEGMPGADTLQNLDTVVPRQRVVEQDASGDRLIDGGQAPLRRCRPRSPRKMPSIALAQETFVEKTVVLAVVDDQYSYCFSHARRPWEARRFRTSIP